MADAMFLKTDPDIVFREEEGGAFLFNAGNCVLKGLNETGKLIWSLCDGSRTEDQIFQTVSEVFSNEDKSMLEKDVREFILELKKIGYIKEK